MAIYSSPIKIGDLHDVVPDQGFQFPLITRTGQRLSIGRDPGNIGIHVIDGNPLLIDIEIFVPNNLKQQKREVLLIKRDNFNDPFFFPPGWKQVVAWASGRERPQ